jgi:hypothetical protein
MINQLKRIAAINGLLCALAVMGAAAQVNVITPGQGIGLVHVGDTVTNAIRNSGWKSQVIKKDTKTDSPAVVYYLVYEKERVMFAFKRDSATEFKNCRLDTIIIMNPIFVVSETGERVGGKLLKHPDGWADTTVENKSKLEKVHVFKNAGISFSIDEKSGRISCIAVFKP